MVEEKKEILVLGSNEFGSPETIIRWADYLCGLPFFYFYGASWIAEKLKGTNKQHVGIKSAIRLASKTYVLAFWNHRCSPDNVERVLKRAPDKRIVGQ